MKFLADENIDQEIIEKLRQDGHDVVAVAEMEPGSVDDRIFRNANQESLILMTADKDFGEIVFRQKKISYGVVLVRLAGLSTRSKSVRIRSSKQPEN